MFSSGVFWMGLIFIPITSLVFDVAYKVWVEFLQYQTATRWFIFLCGHRLIYCISLGFQCSSHLLRFVYFDRLAVMMCKMIPVNFGGKIVMPKLPLLYYHVLIKQLLSITVYLEKNIILLVCYSRCNKIVSFFSHGSIKRVCFKTLVDEVQELEALSKDPGAVVHGKRWGPFLIHS